MAIGLTIGKEVLVRPSQARISLLVIAVVVLFVNGCGMGGRQEHEAGEFLSRVLFTHLCQTEVKDFTSPCGPIDVRYEAAPKKVSINVYGVYALTEISESVNVVRQAKEAKLIRFAVTVKFYRNLGSHAVIHSERIGA